MAASLGMRLFSPLQIWLSFTVALTMLLIADADSIWRLAETENQRLTDLAASLALPMRTPTAPFRKLNEAIVEAEGAGAGGAA